MIKSDNFKKIFINNARLIKEDKIIEKAWVLISGGKIKDIGCGRKNISGCVKINANNNFLAAGFIDLHIHGDIEKISTQQAKFGTTAFLFGLHADKIARSKSKIQAAKQKILKGAACLGFHYEGPFINPEMSGAQPIKGIIAPTSSNIDDLLRSAENGKIKIVTLASELKGALNLIKKLRKNKIVAAIGHTNATIEQAQKGIDAGISYATHTFNRMSGISARNPGAITQVLLDDRVYTEIIADAHHVHPDLLKLLAKQKPRDRIVLVTDSVKAMDALSLKKIQGVYRLENYTIAGSSLNLLNAVNNMIKYAKVNLNDALKMASLNPAKVIGLDKRKGKMTKNFDADIVIFDDQFKCKMTIVGGNIVHQNLKSDKNN